MRALQNVARPPISDLRRDAPNEDHRWFPLVYLLASAASIGLPTFAAVVAVFTAVLATLLVPHYRQLAGRRWWTLPVVFLVATAACVVGLRATTGYGPDQPRPDYVQYTLDADTGHATWLSTGSGPDEWTRQFFPDGYTSSRRAFSPGYYFDQKFDVIQASAPAVALPSPQLRVFADSTASGVRTLRLRLTSPRGAPVAHLDLDLLGDLSITVTDPAGVNIPVRPYEGDVVYEKLDLTKGRAVATFHGDRAGGYLVKVTGAHGGHLTVGESFARHALPGVLAGVGIAVLSVITGTTLWVVVLIRARRRGMEGERP